MSSLLEFDAVSKRFSKRLDVIEKFARRLGAKVSEHTVHAVDQVTLRRQRTRGRRAGRRVGLRQIDAGPRGVRALCAERRRGALSRRSRWRTSTARAVRSR